MKESDKESGQPDFMNFMNFVLMDQTNFCKNTFYAFLYATLF